MEVAEEPLPGRRLTVDDLQRQHCRFQFSLGELALWTTIVSVHFGICRLAGVRVSSIVTAWLIGNVLVYKWGTMPAVRLAAAAIVLVLASMILWVLSTGDDRLLRAFRYWLIPPDRRPSL